jgi:hypothetical protein
LYATVVVLPWGGSEIAIKFRSGFTAIAAAVWMAASLAALNARQRNAATDPLAK